MKRPDVSHLIARVADGDTDAQNELFRLVYDELRRSAQHHVRRSAANLTINPTTLVHETWIKLVRGGPRQFEGSAHFYNVVAQASTDYSSSSSLSQKVSWSCIPGVTATYTIETSWYGRNGELYSFAYPGASIKLTCSN